jgi:uncharacterized membrane protein
VQVQAKLRTPAAERARIRRQDLIRETDPDIVAAQFRGYGGTILRTTLNPDQQAKVERVLSKSAA